MYKNRILYGFSALIAMSWMAVYAAAQVNVDPAVDAAMPRLALPVAREDYPVESFIANEEGHVVLLATIGADGQMSKARLETTSGHLALDEASIELANNARLPVPPTNAAGQPVRVDVIVDVVWELPDRASVARSNSPQSDAPQTVANGLQQDPDSDFALALLRPDVNFSEYDKFIIAGPEVAFRDGWRRQHSRATLNDMTRIEREQAVWFRDVVVATLEEGGRMQLVEEAGPGVLIIRTGIGDLDVAAPFLSSDTEPGYSLSSGGTSASLVLELFDSVSGVVLARLLDRQHYSSANFNMRSTRNTNERDSRILFRGWAEILQARLNEDRAF